MRAFDLKDVRVALAGRGAPLAQARWLLERVGVAVIAAGSPDDAPQTPLLIGGGALAEPAPADRQLTVRLWDFQVGVPGTGLLASAVSGVAWVIGLPGRAPKYLPARIPEKWCGTLAVSLALSHYVECLTLAQPHAEPRAYDVSAAEILRAFADQNFGNHKQIPTSWRRNGRVSPEHGGIYPQGFFACRDGYVGVVGRSRQDWNSILAALGNPAWATDEMRNPFELARNSEKVDPLFTAELAKYTRHQLLELALESGATFAPVFDIHEVPHEQLVRESFFESGGVPGLPFEVRGSSRHASA